MKTGLSVVIPAYNEEKNVAQCLNKVHSVLKSLSLDWEIILVNDGSRDRTGLIARRMARTIPHLKVVENNPNRGYGGSLKAGFAASSKEFIAFVPADNQFDFSEITRLLSAQKDSNADIISGIRANRRDPLHRKVIGWGWNSIVRALFGFLASDIDCGFKLFRRKILDYVSLPAERGAMIDTQLFAGARARGFKVAEVELTHLPRTAGHGTGINPDVIIQSFIDLFKYWWQLKHEILVEKGLAVFRWEALLILSIILVGGFMRLYRIGEYMTFLGDEGRDAIVVREIVLGRHFPAIGPGTSIGSMYLGPMYYYFIAPALWAADFSPVGPSVLVALVGLATIALLWWIGRQWFGRWPALAVSVLYAVSPTVVIYSRSSWNPNIMPFFALLAMYGIWKVWRLGYWRWLIVTAVSLAFVLQSHYLGVLLLPVAGLFWALAALNSRRGFARYTWVSFFLFVLLMSPLLWFDSRHDWTNLRALGKFLSERQTTVNFKIYKAVPNLWPIWANLVGSMLAAKQAMVGNFLSGVTAVAAVVAVFAGRRRLGKNYPDFLFALVWLVVGLIGLGLYKQHIYDHYYGFLFPVVFLLLGFLIYWIYHSLSVKPVKFIIIGSVVGLLWLNLRNSPQAASPNNQLSRTRQVAEFIQRESGGRPFNLAMISKSNYDASYRYFLALNGAPYYTIHERLTDQLFVICEDPDCQPVGHPLWEIAAFGWAKIDREWEFPWPVKLFRLVPNPSGT